MASSRGRGVYLINNVSMHKMAELTLMWDLFTKKQDSLLKSASEVSGGWQYTVYHLPYW